MYELPSDKIVFRDHEIITPLGGPEAEGAMREARGAVDASLVALTKATEVALDAVARDAFRDGFCRAIDGLRLFWMPPERQMVVGVADEAVEDFFLVDLFGDDMAYEGVLSVTITTKFRDGTETSQIYIDNHPEKD